jgi:hypothetical protein
MSRHTGRPQAWHWLATVVYTRRMTRAARANRLRGRIAGQVREILEMAQPFGQPMPMLPARREALYVQQNGANRLTPAQRRRVRHKENHLFARSEA